MGWNEPDKGKDPWGGKSQPPDLDEALRRLHGKIKKTFKRNSTTPESDLGSGGSILALAVFLVIFILWALSGIFIVDPAEEAIILRFGKYVEAVGPGPHWIARFIESKIILNVDRVSHYSYSAQMLTKDETLVSVSIVVQYRIGDPHEYLFNVADPEETLQQATSSALRQVVGTTTLDQLITEGREAWGNQVQDALVRILNIYKVGIVIVNVSPQPARAPENVQDAFDDAIKAQEDEKRFIGQAQAYEARVVPIAEGNAKRIFAEAKAYATEIVLKAKGETAEFLALLPEYTRAPFVTGERLYLDTMQYILSHSSKVLVEGKANPLLYLPWQHLGGSVIPPLSPQQKSDIEVTNQANGDMELFDGRSLTRPTERMARSNS